jgi:hypothetical protein
LTPSGERIDDGNAGRVEVPDVPRHHRQPALQSRGSNQKLGPAMTNLGA